MASFCERLQELKVQNNLMQKTIAADNGLSLRAYQYYERGEREPSMSTLIALAEYFQVSIDFLTGRTDCPDILTYDKDGNPVIIEAMKPHSDKPEVNR